MERIKYLEEFKNWSEFEKSWKEYKDEVKHAFVIDDQRCRPAAIGK